MCVITTVITSRIPTTTDIRAKGGSDCEAHCYDGAQDGLDAAA